MRRIARGIGWIGLAGLLAAGLWLVAAVATDRLLEAGIAELRRAGWEVDLSHLETNGFPGRLETEIADLRAATPLRDVVWQSADLRLNHALLSLGRVEIAPDPAASLLLFPVRLDASAARAEMAVRPLPPFAVREIRVLLDGLTARHVAGPALILSEGRSALTEVEPGRYAADLRISDARVEGLDVPPISLFTVEGALGFDAPWTAMGALPAPTTLTVDTATLQWGASRFTAEGELRVDENGLLSGRLDMVLEEWRDFLDQALAAGLLTPQGHSQFGIQARLLAELSDGPDRIEAPLVMENGRVFLGPFPLGPAPQLQRQ